LMLLCHHHVGSLRLFLLLLRPPPTSTLFPYTTLFRSSGQLVIGSERAPRARATAVLEHRCELIDQLVHHFAPRRRHLLERLLERSEEHTSELQSRSDLVCRLLLEKKKQNNNRATSQSQ